MTKDSAAARELTDLPNIGRTVAEKLKAAGVGTPEQLRDWEASRRCYASRPTPQKMPRVAACCPAWKGRFEASAGTPSTKLSVTNSGGATRGG